MVDAGLFLREKVELLGGELVEMSPQGIEHRVALTRLARVFQRALLERVEIAIQMPLAATDDSEPEPDIALVALDEKRREHPRQAYLVVEVADRSRKGDLGDKAELYARSEVVEYWVVDLVDDAIHVFRDRGEGRWANRTVHRAGDTIAPTTFPEAVVEVAAIFREA